MEALLCDIQRFSIHDGPGIRTTLFFKGCPLACRWCQNPETISFGNEPVYSTVDCFSCGDCAEACPESAISTAGGSLELDRRICSRCLKCTEVCPTGALTPAAKKYTPGELLAEVLRDVDYYDGGGGITLSGGEPLSHPVFLKAFLPQVQEKGIHVAVETAGYVPAAHFDDLADFDDLFLFDLKVMDGERHRALTGRSNGLILDNLRRLVGRGGDVNVRMPLIPGINDDAANLEWTARLLDSLGLTAITLLPFHRLGEGKRVKIGVSGGPFSAVPPDAGKMAAAGRIFESRGIEVLST